MVGNPGAWNSGTCGIIAVRRAQGRVPRHVGATGDGRGGGGVCQSRAGGGPEAGTGGGSGQSPTHSTPAVPQAANASVLISGPFHDVIGTGPSYNSNPEQNYADM